MSPQNLFFAFLSILLFARTNESFSQDCIPFFGQNAPQDTSAIFAPPAIQANSQWFWHGTPTFSPDGNEMYFVKYLTEINKTRIWFSVCQNGVWSEPQQAPFSSQTASDNNPRFGQSADTLYFLSQRPQSRIYRVVRTNGGAWSNPVALSLVIPGGKQLGLQFSMSQNGNIYSELSNNDGSNSEIYCWKKTNASYQIPILISGINSTGFDGFPTIDAYERFILFSSDRNPVNDNFDIYISFRSPDNIWSEPINLSQ